MIASVTTTCTRMMSSILGLLTSTWPRANAEREHGIQSIVGLLAIGNFSPTIKPQSGFALFTFRCYVDDSNTCSDSKFGDEGSPYNWSCQACTGEYIFLDAIASPITYPWVSGSVIDSFRLEIAIASLSFASLLKIVSSPK